jgi:hypothetical protein
MTFTRSERAVLTRAQRIKRVARGKAKRARPVSPKADRGRVRDNGYLAFLRRQPCVICASPRSDAAHIRTPKPGEPPTGLQRKPDDRRATALCRYHHALQHSMRELDFWRVYFLDPFEIAERLYSEYLAGEVR